MSNGAATPNKLELAQIKLQERIRFQQIDIGQLRHPLFLRPCTVKILMLVDTGISYNQFYFGLSEVLDTLRDNPEWWVNFEVTRAHRQTDPNPPAAGSAAEPGEARTQPDPGGRTPRGVSDVPTAGRITGACDWRGP